MTDYTTRITAMTVNAAGEALFSEMATEIRIVDEAAGEFVEVDQSARSDMGKISIDPEEWPTLRAAIDQMIDGCAKEAP
jgi:hypothetical protein